MAKYQFVIFYSIFNTKKNVLPYKPFAFVKNLIPIHPYSNTYLLHRWLTWAIRTHWAEQLLWTSFQTASSRSSMPLDNSFLQQSGKCLHFKKHWVRTDGLFKDLGLPSDLSSSLTSVAYSLIAIHYWVLFCVLQSCLGGCCGFSSVLLFSGASVHQ